MEAATATRVVSPAPGAPEVPERPRAQVATTGFGWMDEIAGMMIMMGQAIRSGAVPPYTWWPEFIEQTSFIIKRSFIPLLFCTFVFSWGAPGITGGSLVSALGTTDRLGAFAVMASVRELATWINGMVVAGVAGTAICSDLGARKIRDELDALSVLGTDLIKTLVVPRILALGVMTVIFNYWNTAISIAGTMVADMVIWKETAAGFMATFGSNFTIPEVMFNTIKVMTFGFIIGIVCCYKGMNAQGGAAGVGRAVNQAVVMAFCAIYIYNYLINSLLLGAFPETATLR